MAKTRMKSKKESLHLRKTLLDMDLKTKYLLIEKLVNTEDDGILNQVKQILENYEGDFWDKLSDREKQDIETGIAELERGEGLPHDEVMKELKGRFLKKK